MYRGPEENMYNFRDQYCGYWWPSTSRCWDICRHSDCPVHILDQHPKGFNTLRLRWNRCHFANDIFKCIFLNEIVLILIKISLQSILKDPINNISAFGQIMAWCRPGDKPLSEPMMVIVLMHICVTQPQRVKEHWIYSRIFVLIICDAQPVITNQSP